jgi:branched-chain amino acid transport system ATP-binding protein
MPDPLLQVESVSRHFGGVNAVDDINFSVDEGEVFGVIGPNGAGKTTLLNCISGVFRPQQGEIKFNGSTLVGLRPNAISRTGIARTFQVAESFRSFTVLDYIMLGRIRWRPMSLWKCGLTLPSVRREEREQVKQVMALIERHGLSSSAHTILRELPYGYQKLVDIVRALAAEPQLLLLDEPTSGSSSDERMLLRQLMYGLKDTGVTAVLVDHDVSFVSDCCTRVLAMANGSQIATGTSDEVLASPIVVSSYIGEEVAGSDHETLQVTAEAGSAE